MLNQERVGIVFIWMGVLAWFPFIFLVLNHKNPFTRFVLRLANAHQD